MANNIKRIGFISRGFAFNRLNRLRYYEKIFPKETEIFLLTAYNPTKEELKKWGLKKIKIINFKKNGLGVIPELRKICKENKLDRIINLGSRFTGAIYPIITAGLKTDFMLAVNGSMPTLADFLKKPNRKDLYRLVLTPLLTILGKKTIFVDYKTHLRFKKTMELFGSSKKIFSLPAPVDTNLFHPRKVSQARKKTGLPLDKEIILFVGRVNYGKGADVFGKLAKNNPSKLFVTVGEMTDKTFKEYAKLDNVRCISKKFPEELVDYYNSADLGFFLQRSIAGGLGQTAQESIACGVPALVRKEEGLIVKSKALIESSLNTEEVNDKINKYFALPKKERNKLSKIARDLALKYYSGEKLSKNYIKYYLS